MASDPLERLRLALREASADQFAAVMSEPLGARLREDADRLLDSGVGEFERELRRFRTALDRFEERGRHDRCTVVAHGMRIGLAIAAKRAEQAEANAPRPSRAKQDLGRRMGKSSEVVLTPTATPTPAAALVLTPTPEPVLVSTPIPAAAGVPTPTPTAAKREPAPVPAALVEAEDPQLLQALQRAAAKRQASVETLHGVGKKTLEKLAARGLRTIEDLAFLLPLGYEDRRQTSWLHDVPEGVPVVIEAVIRSFRQGWARGRYMATLRVEQTQPNGARLGLEARWFHQVGLLAQRVETGKTVLLAGTIKRFQGKLSMVHPELLDPELGLGIALRYPVIEGLGQRTVQNLCRAAVERLREVELIDPLPPELVARHHLPTQIEALAMLHDPPSELSPAQLATLIARTSPAHRRLAFEEFFILQLALLRQRGVYRAAPCALPPIAEGSFDRERLRACLPFEPTRAQWRVIGEIEADLARPKPMLRLLQGDVGSGKTAVAFAAALAVISAGAQAALMAPTEILAEQHLRSMSTWAQQAGVRMALLTGATPRAQRTSMLALLAAGQLDLIVGTHALLVDDVEFARLALVIVDEQHRFGVEQRGALRDKGGAPHLLVMTATPIPRSLALTAFGELDVSIIDELPPGRVSPVTKVFAGPRAIGRARAALVERVKAGDKAYVVCPLVEASEAIEASDVEATAAELRKLLKEQPVKLPRSGGGIENPPEVGVVHGRMLSRDKDAIMQRFRSGELRVLVATTVIEVGVDVPDARAILVEHAERFGLAQLHQLRGRVGRSQGHSLCLLHTASTRDSDAGSRLAVLEASGDGFVVAEKDLEIRGPGELFGTKQSGVPRLRFASFSSEGMKMLVAAREAAMAIIERDPLLARHGALRLELALRTGGEALWAGESG